MATPTPTPTPYQVALQNYMQQFVKPSATPTPGYGPIGTSAASSGGTGGIGAGAILGQYLARKGIASLGSQALPATPNIVSAGFVPEAQIGAQALGSQAAAAEAGASAVSPVSSLAAGQPSGVLSGTSGLGYWAGPAAFIASAPIWAPKVAKGGDWAMKKLGLKNDKPDRHFNLQEALQSKIIQRQAPNVADRNAFLNKAAEIGALGLPGHADSAGNTVKGVGQEFIKPRWFTADDFLAAKQAGKRIEPRAMKVTDWKMPGNITKKARAEWESLLAAAKPEADAKKK